MVKPPIEWPGDWSWRVVYRLFSDGQDARGFAGGTVLLHAQPTEAGLLCWLAVPYPARDAQ